MSESWPPSRASLAALWRRYFSLAILVGLILVLVWAYWNSLTRLAHLWENPQYSHGYLVPLFTLILLWLRRDSSIVISSELTALGGGLLAAGVALPFIFQESVFPPTD